MRRAPIVIAATVVGSVAVFLYRPMAGTPTAVAVPGSGSTAVRGSGSTGVPAPGPSLSAGSGASGGSGTAGSITGNAVSTPYGPTEVRVTIAGGKLTEVSAVELPNDDRHSAEISAEAEPILKQEALTKQGAAVDVVSGATYTSESYMASLQSALDKAGYRAPDGSKASTAAPSEGGDGGGFGFGH